jgi:hypothetical protein
VVRILIVVAVVLGAFSALGPHVATAAAESTQPVPVSTDDITVDTANPFLPESADLTGCIGTMQRPGCGSRERGGWHQYLVAIVMIGGLLIVFGRVGWGVARNRRSNDDDIASTP